MLVYGSVYKESLKYMQIMLQHNLNKFWNKFELVISVVDNMFKICENNVVLFLNNFTTNFNIITDIRMEFILKSCLKC